MKWVIYVTVWLVSLNTVAHGEERFRMHFGSCHNILRVVQDEVKPKVWKSMKKRGPDAFVWGGDNIYADRITSDLDEEYDMSTPDYFPKLYNLTSTLSEYQDYVDFVGPENIVGTWDDHDYGYNNEGESFTYKLESMQHHLDFFNVSQDDPRRTRDGVYNSHLFFNDKIKVILLDNRFNRDDYKNKSGDYLGLNQWNWFESELNENMPDSVEATVIVAGLQMISEQFLKDLVVEHFGKFPYSRSRLLETIAKSKAKNVVLVSGDVHYSELSAAKCTVKDDSSGRKHEYVLPELTTSGMTHSLGTKPFPIPVMLNMYYTINRFPYQVDNLYTFNMNIFRNRVVLSLSNL